MEPTQDVAIDVCACERVSTSRPKKFSRYFSFWYMWATMRVCFNSTEPFSLLNFRCLFAPYYENKQSEEEFIEKGKHMWNTRMHALVHLHFAKVQNNWSCEHCTVFVSHGCTPTTDEVDDSVDDSRVFFFLILRWKMWINRLTFIYFFVWNACVSRASCAYFRSSFY